MFGNIFKYRTNHAIHNTAENFHQKLDETNIEQHVNTTEVTTLLKPNTEVTP